MTEGGAIKTKRNGIRVFKNPPQPHMCIEAFMQGSKLPCYVNVLSWDKIGMVYKYDGSVLLDRNAQLYGGMRVSPPRGEKAEFGVFAVIANPELLKLFGKNAQYPEKRPKLIEVLLDFVESENEGVYFSRQYTILKDKDIIGELKEVWMAVQSDRDRENIQPQQETWIDAQPYYPQYSEQQQTQQLPTPQQQQQHIEYAQPPQYRSSVAYPIGAVPSSEIVNHEREIRFNYPQQNPVVTQSDQVYQSFNSQDRCYNYRERGRPNVQQNPNQQNCPVYPAPQYQFQQIPRLTVSQYINPKMHINSNPNYNMPNQDFKMNLGFNPKFYDLAGSQQQGTEKDQSNAMLMMQMQQRHIQQQQHMQHQVQQQQHVQQQHVQQLPVQQQQPQIQLFDVQQHIQQLPVQQQQQQIQLFDVQQHQIQMHQHQVQEQQQQSINYHQSSNQQYQQKAQQQQKWDEKPHNGEEKAEKRLVRSRFYKRKSNSHKLSNRDRKDVQLNNTKSRFQLHENDMTNHVTDVPERTKTIVLKKNYGERFSTQKSENHSICDNFTRTQREPVINSNDQGESYHQAYTILKKPEVSKTSAESNATTSSRLEDELGKKIAQISIEDCKDATEVNVVLS